MTPAAAIVLGWASVGITLMVVGLRGRLGIYAVGLALAVTSVVYAVAADPASAEEPPVEEPVVYDVEAFEQECPDADSAGQQYQEIIETAAGACRVWVERFDQFALLVQDQDLGKKLQGIRSGIPITNEEPLAVAETEPVSLEMTEAAVTAAGNAQKEAVWAFAGLAVGLFFGYGIYRQVMARG